MNEGELAQQHELALHVEQRELAIHEEPRDLELVLHEVKVGCELCNLRTTGEHKSALKERECK